MSADEIPQVRKVAAIAINELIKLIPKTSDTELLNIFSKFFKDEQDSVRMQGIDTCVAFARHLSPPKVQAYIIPYVKKFAEDPSWRIRYLVADRIIDISNGLGLEQSREHLVQYYCTFLKDSESEVRTASISKLAEFSKILDS